MSVMSFPLLVRSVRTSFAEVNPRLEQIAATLGASPLRIFFVITIPLAYKGIVAGALLAFSRALGEFGATILLAGNIPGKTQTFRWRFIITFSWAKIRTLIFCLGSLSHWHSCSSGAQSGCCAREEKADMLLRCRIPLASFELDINVSFEARVTSIFGPSGSGKTTLLDAVAGLRRVANGAIEVGGRTLFSSERKINLPPRERGIGYVPQEGALFPHLSVRKNILFGAGRGVNGDNPKDIIMEHVLDLLEIAHLLPRSVIQLSGGEAQRVALARAILSRPRLLLLDEPLAALDIGLKERILPYLARVRDEFGIPMIYVTHNLTEVLTLADWVLMIQQGKLVAQGAPKETLRSAHALLQLTDDEFDNVLTVTFVESSGAAGTTRVCLASGTELLIPYLPRPANPKFQIRVSADDILVATERPRGISAGNVISGAIRRIETLDGEALLTVLAGDEFFVRLTSSAISRLALKEDSSIFLIINTALFACCKNTSSEIS